VFGSPPRRATLKIRQPCQRFAAAWFVNKQRWPQVHTAEKHATGLSSNFSTVPLVSQGVAGNGIQTSPDLILGDLG
jgi:hypothetical protein